MSNLFSKRLGSVACSILRVVPLKVPSCSPLRIKVRTLTRSDEWPRARESFSFVLDLSKLHSFGEQKLTMGSPRVEKILYVDKYSALLFGSAVLGCVTKNRTFRRNGNVPFSQIRTYRKTRRYFSKRPFLLPETGAWRSTKHFFPENDAELK